MLQTSVDLWYFSLSVGLLVLIGFISFVLYKIGKLISDFSLTVGEVNHKLEMTDETVNLANDSLRMVNESLRNILMLIDQLVETFNQASGEIKKAIGAVSSMSGLVAGIVTSLSSTKKK